MNEYKWTPRFSERMQKIKSSAIRDLFDRGYQQQDVVDLSIGQADFPVPEVVKQATIKAIRDDCGRYSKTEGFAALLDPATAHLREQFHLPMDEQVIMTVGASGALTLALLALTGPGDEVLIPDPHFVIYPNLARITGATPVPYNLYPDFRLRPDHIEAAMTERTRVLVLNSPANPTGTCATEEELAAVAEICERRNIVVVSDELYSVFVYEGEHVTIKRHLGERALLIGGVSKSFGMAGWRLGWAAGDPRIIDRMRTLQQFTMTCPPTLVQYGAVEVFGLDMSEQVEIYRRKRDLVYDGLTSAGYEVERPSGAFYMFPKVPWGDDLSFVAAAAEQGLLLVPGRAFSFRDTHFRLCFSHPEESLMRGVKILERLAKQGQ